MKMHSLRVLVISTLVGAARSAALSFPAGFKFGAASSAYQVEGAWNVSDKGESIWDRHVRAFPERVAGGGSGDVACDSYRLWQRDVEMAVELGLHFYRFSISWPRLLPTGFPHHVSEDGKMYYSNLIDGLLKNGIEPVVTLYHWDLPQKFQDYGGWSNPLIAEWFADYARVAFALYGGRVRTWLTVNEPVIVCDLAHNTGALAPGLIDEEVAPYLCNKHVLLAHAKAWRVYDEEFRHKYHGRVSIVNHLVWYEPKTDEDKELAELAIQNCAGRYSHPIYSKEGGWPPAIEEWMEEISRKKGYHRSKLPAFTAEEIELIKGTYDFYAMNHYTSRLVRKALPGEQLAGFPMFDCPDLDAKVERHEDWHKPEESSWFWVYPEGIRRQLSWLKQNYGDLEFAIAENGYASGDGLDDHERVDYYRKYLMQVLLSIKEDGVNVTRYTAWTLMDNFEWMAGYTTKFGLYQVDFSSPERTRKPKASAQYYASVIKSHSLATMYREEL